MNLRSIPQTVSQTGNPNWEVKEQEIETKKPDFSVKKTFQKSRGFRTANQVISALNLFPSELSNIIAEYNLPEDFFNEEYVLNQLKQIIVGNPSDLDVDVNLGLAQFAQVIFSVENYLLANAFLIAAKLKIVREQYSQDNEIKMTQDFPNEKLLMLNLIINLCDFEFKSDRHESARLLMMATLIPNSDEGVKAKIACIHEILKENNIISENWTLAKNLILSMPINPETLMIKKKVIDFLMPHLSYQKYENFHQDFIVDAIIELAEHNMDNNYKIEAINIILKEIIKKMDDYLYFDFCSQNLLKLINSFPNENSNEKIAIINQIKNLDRPNNSIKILLLKIISSKLNSELELPVSTKLQIVKGINHLSISTDNLNRLVSVILSLPNEVEEKEMLLAKIAKVAINHLNSNKGEFYLDDFNLLNSLFYIHKQNFKTINLDLWFIRFYLMRLKTVYTPSGNEAYIKLINTAIIDFNDIVKHHSINTEFIEFNKQLSMSLIEEIISLIEEIPFTKTSASQIEILAEEKHCNEVLPITSNNELDKELFDFELFYNYLKQIFGTDDPFYEVFSFNIAQKNTFTTFQKAINLLTDKDKIFLVKGLSDVYSLTSYSAIIFIAQNILYSDALSAEFETITAKFLSKASLYSNGSRKMVACIAALSHLTKTFDAEKLIKSFQDFFTIPSSHKPLLQKFHQCDIVSRIKAATREYLVFHKDKNKDLSFKEKFFHGGSGIKRAEKLLYLIERSEFVERDVVEIMQAAKKANDDSSNTIHSLSAYFKKYNVMDLIFASSQNLLSTFLSFSQQRQVPTNNAITPNTIKPNNRSF